MANYKHKTSDFFKVFELADKGVADNEISIKTGLKRNWVANVTARYWKDKMNIKQVDDYLRKNFPGGNIKHAAYECGVTEMFIKRRVMKLNIDPNMIFEIIKK
jgi:hypothetical protein